jgi:hypothetical protein
MPVNVNKIIRKLSPAERKKVKDRAAKITREEMDRRARKLRQAQRLVRKRVKPGTSLVDELLSERRSAARSE